MSEVETTLRATAARLCTENPDDYAANLSVGDALRAADEIAALRARAERAEAERDALRGAVTPKPMESAPKDRLIIGVERPPFEEDTFYYALHWNEAHGHFMTYPLGAFNGATHYLDPRDLPGLPEDGDAALAREGGE